MESQRAHSPKWVDVHIDPLCPFAYQASRWLREVRDATGLEINWRFFSLEEINLRPGQRHPWEREWTYGWSLMRIGAYLRRQGMHYLDAWFDATGEALHQRGEKPHDRCVASTLIESIGFTPSVIDEALLDPTTHDEVMADHQRVLRGGGFGVPTLVFPNNQMFFGPVLINPPKSTDAVKLWQLIQIWTEFPDLFEIQRTKDVNAQHRIAESLQPYLRGRDWESINRSVVTEPIDPLRH